MISSYSESDNHLFLFSKKDLINYVGPVEIELGRHSILITDDSATILAFINRQLQSLSKPLDSSILKTSGGLLIKVSFVSIGKAMSEKSVLRVGLENQLNSLLGPLSDLIPIRLVFQARIMQSFVEDPNVDPEKGIKYFDPVQLTTLVQNGSWNLDQSGQDGENCVNLVLIETDGPTYLQKPNGAYTNTFRYPDWGAVVFADSKEKLDSIPELFSALLLKLLGFDPSASIKTVDIDRFALTLIRQSILFQETAKEALKSLLANESDIVLTPSFSSHLKELQVFHQSFIHSLTSGSMSDALNLASDSSKLMKHTYFHDSLLGRLYFPNEHKLAVYGPLIVPAVLPILVGLVKLGYQRSHSVHKQK